MKILLTGSKGLLGINFLENFSKKYKIFAISYHNKDNLKFNNTSFLDLDIRKTNELKRQITKFSPNLIIHAASYGDVDFCQNHKREAYRLNTLVTENIAKMCKKQSIKLIFLSTNAIYDGTKPPYNEKSVPNPVNHYGATKLEAEQRILKTSPNFIILRAMTMYGWNQPSERQNPATWIKEKLENGEKINMVNDIYNNALYVYSAAQIMDKLINKWTAGEVFNIAGSDCINRFEFAKKIANTFKYDSSLINPVKSSFFKQSGPRPKNTCFNTNKIRKYLNYKIWTTDQGLTHMKEKNPSFLDHYM